MLSFLKNHPFAVEAYFESSLVLTYAVPKEQLQTIIPAYLTLDTLHDTWAFIAVAMVKTRKLRPKGFPSFLGHDFFLTGYRIFVRYTTSGGKRLRGLYILKSETNKWQMTLLGNLFSHYRYSSVDIDYSINESIIKIKSHQSNINIEVDSSNTNNLLPAGSPFLNWKEARRFAGPLPFTFSYNNKNNQVVIIEGVRENWTPKPVQVITSQIGFINQLNVKNAVLANAFIIQNIPYYWKRGTTDTWKKESESLLKA